MKITVTQEHINRGIRSSIWQCPIALAIKEQTKGRVLVAGSTSLVTKNGVETVYNLPETAARFIINFDNGDKVVPMEFDI